MLNKLSIVVPCYNERENIPLLLERFKSTIAHRNIQVILVNNGSTDGSDSVLESILPEYPFAKTVHVPVNKGYGYGIISGLKSADGDFIGWTHADLQTDPEDISRVYDLITNSDLENIYVKGNRKKRPLIDTFFTVSMSLFETIFLRTALWDINAQPNIFPKSFMEELTYYPDDFSLDLYMYYMAKRRGVKIQRIDVLFTERLHGASKWNDQTFKAKWKFIKRTMVFSLEMKRRLKEK